MLKVSRKFLFVGTVSHFNATADTISELSTSGIWENNTVENSSELSTSEIWESEISEKSKARSLSFNSSVDSDFILPLGKWKNGTARRNSERISFKRSSELRRNGCRSINSSCSSLGLMP